MPLIIIIFFLRLSVHNFDLSLLCFFVLFFNAILFFCGFVLNLSHVYFGIFLEYLLLGFDRSDTYKRMALLITFILGFNSLKIIVRSYM